MIFGEVFEDFEYFINDEIKDLVMNVSIIIEGIYVMILDVFDMFGFEVMEGNNFLFVVSIDDDEKIDCLFKWLFEGGIVIMLFLKFFGLKSMVF